MAFKFSNNSLSNLIGIHPDLVKTVKSAILITEVDICILEGKRSLARQQLLFDKGASKTMNSRHLTGHAIDLGAWLDGQLDWSWPLYRKIADAMKKAAKSHNVQIEWGGDWRTFKDGAHFQLPWRYYPIKKEEE